jgi:uncharacterized protein YqhQ
MRGEVAKFYYGGQAVLEGVMMRGRKHMAVAVRRPDGAIVTYDEPLSQNLTKYSNWPLLRGVMLLWESMALGMRSLRFSAAVAAEAEEKAAAGTPVGPAPADDDPSRYMAGQDSGIGGAMAVSLLFAVALFFVAPLLLVGWADRFIGDAWASNLIEGAIRLAFLLGYMVLIGRVPEIRRVFGYHGAEHKTINAYEAGVPLTPKDVQRCTVINPRCGTTFLLIVVVLSIIFFVLLGRPPFALRLLSRIVLVPIVAAVAYELIRWAAGHYQNRLVRTLMAPGLVLQGLTTRPPDESMLEVGIAALKRVLIVDGVLAADAAQETRTAAGRDVVAEPAPGA